MGKKYFRLISDGSEPSKECDDFWVCENCLDTHERMKGYESIDQKTNIYDDCYCEFCGTEE